MKWYMYYKKSGEVAHLCASGPYCVITRRLIAAARVLNKRVVNHSRGGRVVFINGRSEKFFISKSKIDTCTTWVNI